MPELTAEQRNLLRQSGGQPVRLIDPDTRQQYILVRAEVFEQLQSLHTDLDPHDLYPALHRALREDGWDDPKLDEYNRYG